MSNINWQVRIRNPYWWGGLVAAVMVPILAYLGLAWEDLTTWSALGEVFKQFISNPYMIGLTVVSLCGFLFGTNVDPTTKGLTDSSIVLTYEAPRADVTEDIVYDMSEQADPDEQ